MNENTINNDVTMAERVSVLAGRYRIIRQLGQGGMGSVWLAEDTQLDNKLFAIKMLPSILVSNKRAYNQLKSEALVAMKLVHPNIVQIRAFEENNGNPFLVMDYIDGETLDDWLADRGQELGASEEDVIRLLKPIAEALDYAHTEGVVHRDVKPANVMIRKDGRPFIMDFGIAREIQETMTRVTGKLSSGTLLYMSPEQLNGASPKKEQDIYSFAAMAYECLKGNPPFCRGAIEDQIKNKEPEPLDIPGALSIARGVMAGLAKNPEERPKTCAAVLSGEGAGSVREESAKRAERPETGRDCVEEEGRGKAHGVGGAIAAMLAAGIFAGGVWFATRNGEPPSKPQPPDPPVTNVVVNPPPLPPPGPVEADVTEIAVQAKVYKERIGRIDDEDGLKERKDALSDLLVRAVAYSQAKRWDKAAVNFTNYVEGCRKLIGSVEKCKVDAEEARSAALAASKQAEAAGAKIHFPELWNAAVAKWKAADNAFAEKHYAKARERFAEVARMFGDSADMAEKVRKAKWRQEGASFTIREFEGLNMTMKWCPPGSFMMGRSDEGRHSAQFADGVCHEVTLTKGFWLGEAEVTQGQWKKLMDGETVVDLARKGLKDDRVYTIGLKRQTLRDGWQMGSDGDPNERCGDLNDSVPVYNVTWFEAVEFCRRLTNQEREAGHIPDGYEYRLPTEAEWEYACRAGTQTFLPNGKKYDVLGENNIPALDDIAWYGGNSSVGMGDGRGVDTSDWKDKQYPGGRAFAREIKGKQSNNWGFYDMIGNVSEWCFDWYRQYPSSTTDPIGAALGSARIIRGGSWREGHLNCCPARRYGNSPYMRRYDLGFRVALAPVHGGMSYGEPQEDLPRYVHAGLSEKVRENTTAGYKAYYEKRYADAFGCFMNGDLENAHVQLRIGYMYRCGQGVPKDEKKAVEWYRKSAMQDNAHAQNDLGIMYANGLGVAMDQVEAVNWYRRAAEKWHADAQNNLGWMYAKGLGVEKNEKEAVKLYKMAAYQGNINAMRNLALMYETGRGVPQDLEEAQRWRTKADAKENDLKNSSQKKVELPKKTVVPKPKQEQKYVPVLKLPDRKPIKVHERRRPINLNFCPHCGSSLKHLEKISQNCPDCKKDLLKK